MANIFDSIYLKKPKYSKFNHGHSHKSTGNSGVIYPILCKEILPGDREKMSCNVFLRTMPLIAPIMDRIDVNIEWYFVPTRLIWDGFNDFITGGKDGNTHPAVPYMTAKQIALTRSQAPQQRYLQNGLYTGSLAHRLGIPAALKYTSSGSFSEIDVNSISKEFRICSLPFRAYQLVYQEYYQDKNLITVDEVAKGSGKESDAAAMNLCRLRKRAYAKDYFTSALPWAQRGPQVGISPVGGRIPLRGELSGIFDSDEVSDEQLLVVDGTSGPDNTRALVYGPDGSSSLRMPESEGELDALDSIANPLHIDAADIPATTINEFRALVRLQRIFETSARVGYRLTEWIQGFFNEFNGDSRLQRPEFLGGAKAPVMISEIANTNGTNADTGNVQGDLAGKGVMAVNLKGFKKHHFTEHGYLLGLMTIKQHAGYSQGLPKMFSRFDNLDFFNPLLEGLGEQSIKEKELFVDYTKDTIDSSNESDFGYQQRWAEYKYHPDVISGDFCSSLAYWHMSRFFISAPSLNQSFIEHGSTSLNRPFAVADENTDHFLFEVYFNNKPVRKMSKFSIPSLI